LFDGSNEPLSLCTIQLMLCGVVESTIEVVSYAAVIQSLITIWPENLV